MLLISLLHNLMLVNKLIGMYVSLINNLSCLLLSLIKYGIPVGNYLLILLNLFGSTKSEFCKQLKHLFFVHYYLGS